MIIFSDTPYKIALSELFFPYYFGITDFVFILILNFDRCMTSKVTIVNFY